MDKQTKIYRVTLVTKGGEVYAWNTEFSETCPPHEWLFDRMSHEFGMIPIFTDKGFTSISIEVVSKISFEEVEHA